MRRDESRRGRQECLRHVVLVFRHVPFEGLGLIAPAIESRGFSYQYIDLYSGGAPLPDTRDAAGLIFMGGPMSVNDPLPYLEQEAGFIRQAMERGQPVLGVCLGSQLIAKALGSRVYRNERKEIGWFDLHLTEAAGEDPVFAGVNATETVFHWHGETFDLPAGATHLAIQRALCEPGVPRRDDGLRLAVPSGSDTGDDRGVVRGGRELRRCRRPGSCDRTGVQRRAYA